MYILHYINPLIMAYCFNALCPFIGLMHELLARAAFAYNVFAYHAETGRVIHS